MIIRQEDLISVLLYNFTQTAMKRLAAYKYEVIIVLSYHALNCMCINSELPIVYVKADAYKTKDVLPGLLQKSYVVFKYL